MYKQNFNPDTNIIYIDLDGVMADFGKASTKYLGKPFSQNTLSKEENETMWNTLRKVDRFFFNLEPMPYLEELLSAIKATGCRHQVLTAIPRRSSFPNADVDKIEWSAKHLGPEIVVKLAASGREKWKHCIAGDIIIDDRKDIIDDWITKGNGIGIWHTGSPTTTIAQLNNHVLAPTWSRW